VTQRDVNFVKLSAKLKETTGIENIIITRGKEGMSLFAQNDRKDIPTTAKQVFDVTGAGDTVIASLGLAWCAGLSLEESCHLANFAAGIVVSKIGCVPCHLEELRQEIATG
jgi:D-glycero-beta-D-manno-heptose-7-phosphate kinase